MNPKRLHKDGYDCHGVQHCSGLVLVSYSRPNRSAADHLFRVQRAGQVGGDARQCQHAVVQRHEAGPLQGRER